MPSSVSASSGMSSLLPALGAQQGMQQQGSQLRLAAGTPVPAADEASGAIAPRGPPAIVPLIHDNLTFDARHATRLRDIEKRMESDLKRKKRNLEREVEQMREEFLKLFPTDRVWGSDELLVDPLVARRRGSTDVLNPRRMKTMITSSPESERRFRIRFDVSEFDPTSVRVHADADRITVKAVRVEETPPLPPPPSAYSGPNGEGSAEPHPEHSMDGGVKPLSRHYCRKIEKPKEVDHTKLKARISADGILLIQATISSHHSSSKSLPRKTSAGPSPSHSFQGTPPAGSRAKSPPAAGSPAELTPSTMKLGVPIFREEAGGSRRMHLAVDVGSAFKPKEITVQAIKDNRILIKAKHEERTSERLCKNKYTKEFELPEKIDTHSLRGGLCADGRLLVGAFVKGHAGDAGDAAGREHPSGTPGKVVIEQLDPHAEVMPCNVLNLASFPPKMSSSASAVSILSHANGSA